MIKKCWYFWYICLLFNVLSQSCLGRFRDDSKSDARSAVESVSDVMVTRAVASSVGGAAIVVARWSGEHWPSVGNVNVSGSSGGFARDTAFGS